MIGQTVSHYRILETIGCGGMSIVYKGQDTYLGGLVALKFMLEKFCGDHESRAQFRQEARMASAVNHPGVCTILGVDQHGDRPFIVMEYLQGQTLRDRMQSCGFTMREAIVCGIQIADVLAEIHTAGIVHRDISPANLFMTQDSRIKLLDFGLATVWPSRSPKVTRALTGTIPYMSPEQVLRQQTDPRSDIFSTGVVLYEMLTGRRPFAGDSVRTIIKQICSTKQKPARSIAPNLSVGIEKVIDRCLEKMPERRYQTASDLKEDLAAAMTGLQTDTMSVMKAKAAVISALDETERTPLFAEAAPDSGVTVDIRN